MISIHTEENAVAALFGFIWNKRQFKKKNNYSLIILFSTIAKSKLG